MRAVVQRVGRASVRVQEEVVGQIGQGLLVLLAVGERDGQPEAEWLADKLVGLRLFANEAGKFDRCVRDVGGAMLVVSQFTLYADVRKGRRPSFSRAAAPEAAKQLYASFCERVRALGVPTSEGRFGEHMEVALVNDGPVTVIVDSAGAEASGF